MRYLLAIVFPPLAVFLCGKPIQAILSILLTLAFWIPGVIHALFVVHAHLNDKRTDRIVKAIKEQGKTS
ncbi:MAG: YqaE/Pmp3 family membrane protein [Pseudomonadota bacterium]